MEYVKRKGSFKYYVNVQVGERSSNAYVRFSKKHISVDLKRFNDFFFLLLINDKELDMTCGSTRGFVPNICLFLLRRKESEMNKNVLT